MQHTACEIRVLSGDFKWRGELVSKVSWPGCCSPAHAALVQAYTLESEAVQT